MFLGPHSREDDNPKPLKALPSAVKLFYVQCWDLLPPVSDPMAPFGPTSREALARQDSADPGLVAGTTTQNRRNTTMPNQPPPPRPPRPPDVIEILMKSRTGETLSVDSPNSFATAVRKILARAGTK